METSVEPLEGNRVKLHIAVPADEFEHAIDAAFRKLAREVRIPGFRPGKAPRRVLEARLGPEVAREQALKDALPGYYADAVAAEDLDTIAPPEIDITAGEEQGGVEFDAVVEVRPVVELEGYDALRVEVDYRAPTDEDVAQQIDTLRERFADLAESSRPLADGDYAQIDIKGYVHDEQVDALTASDFLYEIGSASVTPRLDDELRGKRPGDILKFNDVLPERFQERAGQEVAFQVLVKETKRKVLPELTDEWVTEVTELSTVDELRADARRRLELVAKVQAQMRVREEVLRSVASLVPVVAPEPLVREEMERRVHDLAHRLEPQGATVSDYLAATGQDQDEFVGRLREQATDAVLADLALRAVVAQDAIAVSDDELAREVERLAERLGEKPEKLRRDLGRRGVLEAVRSDMARGKALDFLVDHATVVDREGNTVDLTLPEADATPGAEAGSTVPAAMVAATQEDVQDETAEGAPGRRVEEETEA